VNCLKLTKKLAVSVSSLVFGEDVGPIVNELYGKENLSEFKISEDLEMDVHEVRNKLYRLHDKNIVTWIKKKDPKKGWYIYYWTLNGKRIKEIADEFKKDRIEFLQSRLNREKGKLFYICCNKCVRFEFDKATDFDFRCPECSQILMEDDNSKTILNLEQELKKLSVTA
jgi:transcription initiation factor TFIIE subunit alpha